MNNAYKLQKLIKSLFLLISPRTWGPFSLAAAESRFDHSFTLSWSQCAEDLVVAQALEEIQGGRYLDIGAHHPSRFSVTRKLFERGWSGVNVDANKELLQAFRKARPLDVALNVAVGNQSSYELTVFEESAISTVNAEWKERFLMERNGVSSMVNVPGRTLRSILDEFFPNNGPDFLNIDIEGADFLALKSGQFESLPSGRIPKHILIENPNPLDPSEKGEIGSYLESLKYVRLYILPFSSLYKYSG